MTIDIKSVKCRIVRLAAKYKLGHLGSCFSVLPILYELYTHYKNDATIVSNGHAGLAQYCMLEQVYGHNADMLVQKHGVHPCRDPDNHIYCSTGSLGMGLAVAVGMALGGQRTHCVISDGECAEGIVWEALAFADRYPDLPLSVHVNANGWSATQAVDLDKLEKRLRAFAPWIHFWRTSNHPFPDDLSSHYRIITEQEAEEYAQAIC